MSEDLLDGCEIDFIAEAVDDDTAEMLPLFPEGKADTERVGEWLEVFGGPDRA